MTKLKIIENWKDEPLLRDADREFILFLLGSQARLSFQQGRADATREIKEGSFS